MPPKDTTGYSVGCIWQSGKKFWQLNEERKWERVEEWFRYHPLVRVKISVSPFFKPRSFVILSDE